MTLAHEVLERGAIVYLDLLSGPAVVAGLGKRLMAAARAAGFSSATLVTEIVARSDLSVAEQSGFRKLTAGVCGNRPGAVFVVDARRFASKGPPWRRFIELCALSDTFLIDLNRSFDPRRSAHRLLLGLEPAGSSVARSGSRASATSNALTSAERGRSWPYVPSGVSAADARRAAAVEHLFSSRLRRLGSIHAVVCWAQQAGLRVPRVDWDAKGPCLSWEAPCHRSVSELLMAGAWSRGSPGPASC